MRVFSSLQLRGPPSGPLLAVCLLLAGPVPPPLGPAVLAGQFPGELEARVLDARTGEAVAGARIVVADLPGALRAEGDGSFRIRGLVAGTARVTAAAPGYRPEEQSLTIRHGEVTRTVFLLEPRIFDLAALRVRVPAGEAIRLDAGDISRSGARTVGELLERVPGVVVRRRSPGGPEEVGLRGVGGDQVLVLVDGTPLNDPVTGVADLSLLPAAAVTSVEVLPGARGARYGPGALGGVIRIETRAREAGGEGVFRVGSLGEMGGSAAVAGRRGSLDGELSLQLRRLEGAFAVDRGEFLGGGEDRRRNADLRHAALQAGAGGGGIGQGTWRLRVGADQLSRGIPGRIFVPSDSARQEQERVFVQGRWQGAPGGVPVEVAGHHVRQEVRFRDPSPPLGLPFDDRTRLRGSGADLEVPSLPVRDGSLRFGGGLSVRHQAVASDALRGDGRVGRLDLGGFLHGEHLALPIPGRPAVSSALRLHRDGSSGDWLPAHDITVRLPLGPVQLRASHRSSFSPPSPGDQFFREGVGIAPNPDLRAERVPGEVEAGATLRVLRGGLEGHVEAELFRGDMRDMIVWAPDFRFVWSPRNVDVRRRGGEIRGGIRHPSSGLRFGGHAARTYVTYDRGPDAPRVQVIYRPRDTGSLHVAWEPEPLHLEVRARYTGLRYPVAAPVNPLDPFWATEVVISGEWSARGWRVRPLLRVDRMLDERAPFIYAFPEPGRTFLLELRLKPGPRTSDRIP